MTDVNKSVDNCSRDLLLKIDGIGSDIANMSNELADIKKVVNANVSNVAKLIVADSNVDKKDNCLKDELNSSYANIVKCEIRKSVDEVSSESKFDQSKKLSTIGLRQKAEWPTLLYLI